MSTSFERTRKPNKTTLMYEMCLKNKGKEMSIQEIPLSLFEKRESGICF